MKDKLYYLWLDLLEFLGNIEMRIKYFLNKNTILVYRQKIYLKILSIAMMVADVSLIMVVLIWIIPQ